MGLEAYSVKDQANALIGLVLSVLEVTERVKAQELLKQKVNKSTSMLQEKVKELESMNAIMVNRELRMIELKKEIEDLKTRLPTTKA